MNEIAASHQDHDFDWIEAYLACSVDCEFVELKHAAKACITKYHDAYRDRHPQSGTSFEFKPEDQRNFLVIRNSPSNEDAIRFTRHSDHILIEQARRNSVKVTLALNDDGDCRCQINGGGEFLRWQVLKIALHELFLMGSGEGSSLGHDGPPVK